MPSWWRGRFGSRCVVQQKQPPAAGRTGASIGQGTPHFLFPTLVYTGKGGVVRCDGRRVCQFARSPRHVRSRKRAVKFFGWVFFLISSGSPHVRPMGVHRTRGEPDEIELTAMGVKLNGSRCRPLTYISRWRRAWGTARGPVHRFISSRRGRRSHHVRATRVSVPPFPRGGMGGLEQWVVWNPFLVVGCATTERGACVEPTTKSHGTCVHQRGCSIRAGFPHSTSSSRRVRR